MRQHTGLILLRWATTALRRGKFSFRHDEQAKTLFATGVQTPEEVRRRHREALRVCIVSPYRLRWSDTGRVVVYYFLSS